MVLSGSVRWYEPVGTEDVRNGQVIVAGNCGAAMPQQISSALGAVYEMRLTATSILTGVTDGGLTRRPRTSKLPRASMSTGDPDIYAEIMWSLITSGSSRSART